MANYRAIVSITFDDDDLEQLAEECGIERIDAYESINGSLDNLELGTGWLEQLFKNGNPTIHRMSGGINVEVNDHDDN